MIVINHDIWNIELVSPYSSILHIGDGEYTIGTCDNSKKTIYLSNRLRGTLLKKVLCHEIVHAAMFSYNVPLTYRQEEIVASVIDTYGEGIINLTNRILLRL